MPTKTTTPRPATTKAPAKLRKAAPKPTMLAMPAAERLALAEAWLAAVPEDKAEDEAADRRYRARASKEVKAMVAGNRRLLDRTPEAVRAELASGDRETLRKNLSYLRFIAEYPGELLGE